MFPHLRLTPVFCLRLLCVAALGLAGAPLFAGLRGPGDSAQANPPGWTELPASPVPSPGVQRHDDIDFLDAERGWLVNGDGEVWNTKDAGLTWTKLTDTGVYNRCIGVGDSLHAWIGTLYTSGGDALQATSDGGHTWSVVPLPTPKPRGICGMWVVGDSVINGVGAYYGYPRYVRSANRGVTWTVKDMSAYCGALVDVYFWSPDSGVACGSTLPSSRRPRVLMTTDGGATWSVRWTGTRLNELCWKISFVDPNIGFIAIENLGSTGPAYFLKTTDGGLTWTEHLFSTAFRDCEGIGFLTEQIGWIGGWDFPTEETTDGGLTWHDAGFGYNTNRFRFLSPTLAYAVGARVYKYEGDVSGVSSPGGAAPALLLSQNRPNPFGATTSIAYRVTQAGPVTLKVFDAQGRELRTLFSAHREPGGYTATLDAGQLAAGAYFYQLTTPAGVETKKMFLVR